MLAAITVITKSHSYVNYPAFAVLFMILIGPFVGAAIGHSRGRTLLGTFLGFFGIIGWIIVGVLPRTAKAEEHRQAKLASRGAPMQPQLG